MLAIESARPWPMPAAMGQAVRAAAYRISAEIDSDSALGVPSRAVYVPCRHTDGLLPILAGGRVFPGVHQRAEIDVDADAKQLSWSVRGLSSERSDEGGVAQFDIAAVADLQSAVPATSEVADIVIGTELGLSPGHRPGSIESAELCPASRAAQRVDLTSLRSDFLDSFSSAAPAESLLMTDVGVIWRRAELPASMAA